MSMISKQIEFLRDEADYGYHVLEDKALADTLSQAADTIEMLSEKAREPKQEWIPCSERLPDLEEYVLVTLRCGETMIMALDWDDGKIEWKTQEESIIYDDEEVIAWQPLPEPYMEGADDE